MASERTILPVPSDREIRDAYRRSVLDLCHEFSSTELAWDVSQHVLDKMWNTASSETHHQAETKSVAKRFLGTTETSNSNSNSTTTTTTTATYACQSCGYILHPGWKGTTLRAKRPKPCSSKRTLRRRELRKRKKEALKQEKAAKDHRKRAAHNDESSLGQNMVLLRDDPGTSRLDRHHLVLTCGRCKHKSTLRGLRREPPPPQQQHAPKTTKATARQTGGVGDLSENFVRLPELATTQKKPPPPEKSPPLSLLEQKLGRKKKKKKKGANQSGNLLNFLSSLNDH